MTASQILIAVLVSTLACASAFVVMPSRITGTQIAKPSTSLYMSQPEDRRSFLEIAALSVFATDFVISRPAFADVSDGNTLPQGAAQFSRVVKMKSNLMTVDKRLAESGKELDKKEWDGLSDFLRSLYRAGEDMKGVSGGIYDSDKKKQAEETIRLLQKVAQAGDGPVSKQDSESLLVITNKAVKLMDTFFDLLSDVPDEI
eukprot:scaffold28117_cov56-Attheya_sp.AAC.17